ncbi:hypothetical protein THOG11_180042 [Vibrio harveyi]|nr:hypothetical protein TH15OA1_260124 [Vibrio harveyi]CAH1557937.1 hypothetical protein THOD03_210043 [Vibrio harveyi]CAH1559586.1 hypothetical protein THOG11_180042 [Vibrio harveyi]
MCGEAGTVMTYAEKALSLYCILRQTLNIMGKPVVVKSRR